MKLKVLCWTGQIQQNFYIMAYVAESYPKNIISFKVATRGCIFSCLTKIWPNNMLGEKMFEKGMKKGGKMHIFP